MSGNQQWSGKCVCPGRTCEDKSGGRDRIAGQMSVATKKKRRWGLSVGQIGGEVSYCWTNECSDKKEKALGDCQLDKLGGTVICPCCRTVWKKKSW